MESIMQKHTKWKERDPTSLPATLKKQKSRKLFSDFKKTRSWKGQGIVALWQGGKQFPPHTLQSLLSPDSLTSLPASPSHSAASGLPSFSCCSPLILCCLFDFKQFPSNSCFQLRERAVDILQAQGWAGLGLGSRVMADPGTERDTVQLQGNNFCTELWLQPETGRVHLGLMLQLFFLLVNKRLLILLHWKRSFSLTQHWASPNRKASQTPSVWQSYGRDIGIQTRHKGPHSSS